MKLLIQKENKGKDFIIGLRSIILFITFILICYCSYCCWYNTHRIYGYSCFIFKTYRKVVGMILSWRLGEIICEVLKGKVVGLLYFVSHCKTMICESSVSSYTNCWYDHLIVHKLYTTKYNIFKEIY